MTKEQALHEISNLLSEYQDRELSLDPKSKDAWYFRGAKFALNDALRIIRAIR